jgi:hypothetical protein
MFVEFRNVDPANENSVVSYELTSFNQPSGAVLTHARVDRYRTAVSLSGLSV